MRLHIAIWTHSFCTSVTGPLIFWCNWIFWFQKQQTRGTWVCNMFIAVEVFTGMGLLSDICDDNVTTNVQYLMNHNIHMWIQYCWYSQANVMRIQQCINHCGQSSKYNWQLSLVEKCTSIFHTSLIFIWGLSAFTWECQYTANFGHSQLCGCYMHSLLPLHWIYYAG